MKRVLGLLAVALLVLGTYATPQNSVFDPHKINTVAQSSVVNVDKINTTVTRSLAGVTEPVLFVFAHEDDETLAGSVAIAQMLAAGRTVHVLWLTHGEASGVMNVLNGTGTSPWWGKQHVPADEGYEPLVSKSFGNARVREGGNALRALSSGYPGTLTFNVADLPDGGVSFATASARILAEADALFPGQPVELRGHTYRVELDAHPDHVATGQALKALCDSNPTRFSSCRYFLLLRYASDPDLNLVTESYLYPSDTSMKAAVLSAARAYAAWDPPATFAIGMHSVPTDFNNLLSNPRTLTHS